jgi:hypothetical protein
MSLKIHFLHSHLSLFPDNLGTVSDEPGKQCYKDTANWEQQHQGLWDPAMMEDYC